VVSHSCMVHITLMAATFNVLLACNRIFDELLGIWLYDMVASNSSTPWVSDNNLLGMFNEFLI